MPERNAPLPKFGEWDVKNPATATDFSVIFDKARKDKREGIRPPSATRRDQLDSPTRKDRAANGGASNAAGGGGRGRRLSGFYGGKWLCCVGRRHDD